VKRVRSALSTAPDRIPSRIDSTQTCRSHHPSVERLITKTPTRDQPSRESRTALQDVSNPLDDGEELTPLAAKRDPPPTPLSGSAANAQSFDRPAAAPLDLTIPTDSFSIVGENLQN